MAVLSEKVPPWAAIATLLMSSGAALFFSLAHLGSRIGMWSRDIGGNGATPSQVRTITEQALDRKINGGLDRIIAKLEALEDKVDERHAENQHRFGLLQGQLAARTSRRV